MPDLVITGMGAVTSVGLCADQTCSSIRAGISRYDDHPCHYPLMHELSTNDPEPLTCSPVAFLDPLAKAPDRLLDLALAPLEETFTSAGIQRSDLADFGLFLATTPVVEGAPEWDLEKYLLPELYRRAAIRPFPISRVERQGNTGFYHALFQAQKALQEQQCRFCLIGCVDSVLDEETVRHLDAAYRLKSERNRDGFIPGEGAIFVIAESAESARQRKARVYGVIEAISFGTEERPFTGDQVSSGQGLTQVFRHITEQTQVEPEWVMGDLNGESYRAHEWGVAMTRLGDYFQNLKALWHPADCVGDIRAAAPALHLIMVCRAFYKGYAPASSCVMFAANDNKERAGCLVRMGIEYS